MVNDSKTNDLISWGSSGTSLLIWDHNKFSAEILSAYFKHNNFSSFVHQLNCYGFKKIQSPHQLLEYGNSNFQASKDHLLPYIKSRYQRRRCEQTRISTSDTNSKLEIAKLTKNTTEERSPTKENEVLKNGDDEKTRHEGEEEILKKENGPDTLLSNNQVVSILSTDASAIANPIRLDHEINKKRGQGDNKELGGYKYREQIIIILDEEEVCENDGAKKKHAEITAEFNDLNPKPPTKRKCNFCHSILE